jgi:ATP-dependent helicase HrpA
LHQAILTGFLGNIGVLDEKREYLGARGSRFIIAPGTPLASKPPKWVVAGSIMETTRVFARMVANVEPHWIERAGEHLLKRSYAEPQWVEQKGFVGALESVSLYGLTLVGQRRVNYGSVMPTEARQIFVREALVEGRSPLRAAFLKHNNELRKRVESLEAKIRRRDVLMDEQSICDFYLQRLPEHIHSVAAMEKWLRGDTMPSPQPSPGSGSGRGRGQGEGSLLMSLSDLTRRDTADITPDLYPDTLTLNGNALALTYKFEPGQPDDGATLTVPEPLLTTLHADQLDWAIPGWHVERLTGLLRALPKEQRKHFVPVPDAAVRCFNDVQGKLSAASIALWIARESGQVISADQVSQLPIPDHLRVNVRVVRLDGRLMKEGRDLVAVRRALRNTQPVAAIPAPNDAAHRAWDFGDLPIERTVERRGVKFTVYPALRAIPDGVTIVECGSLTEAEAVSRTGLLKLALLSLPQQAKFVQKQFTDKRELVLLSQGFTSSRPPADLFVERVFRECLFTDGVELPRTKTEFDRQLDAVRAQLTERAEHLSIALSGSLATLRAIRQQLKTLGGAAFKDAVTDVQQQLALLTPPDFIATVPEPLFGHLSRYLRAIQRRLERMPGNVKRDTELMQRVAPFGKAASELHGKSSQRIELDKLRWMLEEYRVSLFAQDLKTALPISDKRLTEQLQRAREEAAR